MKIEKYRELIKKTRSEVAEELGVPYVTIAKWETGERKPNNDAMKRIIKWSDGAVMPNDFYDFEVAD